MRLGWRTVLGILLSAGALVWALHDVPLGDVWGQLRRANPLLFLLAAIAATVTVPLRAARWGLILEPVAERVPFGPLWRATAIGNMVTNIVPVRAGELARALVLAREVPRVSFAASLASLAVDRLFDAVVLLALMLLAMVSPDFPAGRTLFDRPIANYVAILAVATFVMMVALYALVFFPQRVVALFEAMAGRLSPTLATRGKTVLETFVAGLGLLRTPRLFGGVLAWTVVHWLMNALAFWFGFRAVGIDAPFTAALFLQTVIGVSVALPAAPGFAGVFEAAGKAGLAVYGVDQTRAMSWAIGYHFVSWLPIVVIGLVYLARMGLRLGDVSRNHEQAGRDA